MKKILNHLATDWYKYLLELIVITAGVVGAFALNNWNEQRKQNIVEHKYLLNLKNDLEADMIGLDTLLETGARKIRASKNLKERAYEDSVGSLYDFSNVIKQLIIVGGFSPNHSTFEEMQSTGNLSRLANDSLKLKLLELNRTYEIIDGFQEHVRNDYNVFLERFEEHVDWGAYIDIERSTFPSYFAFDSVKIELHKNEMVRDVHSLLDDKVILNNIFLIELNFTYATPLLKQTQVDIANIIELINTELDQEFK